MGLIVSPYWKVMHDLYALSAKDRVRTGTISVSIKASLTNKLTEIITACVDYTLLPILSTHILLLFLLVLVAKMDFSGRFAHQMYALFVSLIAMCLSLRSFTYFTILTILGELNKLKILHCRKYCNYT